MPGPSPRVLRPSALRTTDIADVVAPSYVLAHPTGPWLFTAGESAPATVEQLPARRPAGSMQLSRRRVGRRVRLPSGADLRCPAAPGLELRLGLGQQLRRRRGRHPVRTAGRARLHRVRPRLRAAGRPARASGPGPASGSGRRLARRAAGLRSRHGPDPPAPAGRRRPVPPRGRPDRPAAGLGTAARRDRRRPAGRRLRAELRAVGRPAPTTTAGPQIQLVPTTDATTEPAPALGDRDRRQYGRRGHPRSGHDHDVRDRPGRRAPAGRGLVRRGVAAGDRRARRSAVGRQPERRHDHRARPDRPGRPERRSLDFAAPSATCVVLLPESLPR